MISCKFFNSGINNHFTEQSRAEKVQKKFR